MKKYTIWDEIKRMQRNMDSLFNDFLYTESPYLLDTNTRSNEVLAKKNYREPVCDIKEDDSNYTLSLEIPGSKKEDIKVNVIDNNLEIKVEHKKENEKEDKEKGYYSYSSNYIGYYRSFTLPKNTDSENIDAEYKNGVLKLKIPKKEITGSQKLIEIK